VPLFDEARKTLTDALETVKRKYSLCDVLGQIEWKARNLTEAVYGHTW
jgi:hypothetical protein